MVFCNTLTANDRYALHDCENFLSPNQMQLSLNRKSFSDSFVPLLVFISNFKHFGKKDNRHSYFIWEITYRLSKTWLDDSLKNTLSEDSFTVNMLNGPKLL